MVERYEGMFNPKPSDQTRSEEERRWLDQRRALAGTGALIPDKPDAKKLLPRQETPLVVKMRQEIWSVLVGEGIRQGTARRIQDRIVSIVSKRLPEEDLLQPRKPEEFGFKQETLPF